MNAYGPGAAFCGSSITEYNEGYERGGVRARNSNEVLLTLAGPGIWLFLIRLNSGVLASGETHKAYICLS